MKRILHILPQFQPGGGMERVVMNYFKFIDHQSFRFDILTHKIEDESYKREIENNGGQVYLYPSFNIQNLSSIIKEYKNLLSVSKYDAVHCHMANAAFLYLKIAKDVDVPIRILHSHQDHYADSFIHTIRNIPLIGIGKRYANINLACSKESGDFLFGDNKYTILRNSIDVAAFAFSSEKREKKRKEFCVNHNQIVFANIGRLCSQKNQKFVLTLFSDLIKKIPNSLLLIVGDGDLEIALHNYAKQLNIESSVRWYKHVTDMDAIYQAIDVLLFPSLYEGFPMTLVEAQTAGVMCYVSETITDDVLLTNRIVKLPINQGVEPWVEEISNMQMSSVNREIEVESVKKQGYDIRSTLDVLEKIYMGGHGD